MSNRSVISSSLRPLLLPRLLGAALALPPPIACACASPRTMTAPAMATAARRLRRRRRHWGLVPGRLDHGVCNRDHNSQWGGSGDEWTEAAADDAFGAIACDTTCG